MKGRPNHNHFPRCRREAAPILAYLDRIRATLLPRVRAHGGKVPADLQRALSRVTVMTRQLELEGIVTNAHRELMKGVTDAWRSPLPRNLDDLLLQRLQPQRI